MVGDCFQSLETSKSMTRKLAVLTRKWGLILTGLVPSSKLRANTLRPLVKLTANSTQNKGLDCDCLNVGAIIRRSFVRGGTSGSGERLASRKVQVGLRN